MIAWSDLFIMNVLFQRKRATVCHQSENLRKVIGKMMISWLYILNLSPKCILDITPWVLSTLR